MTPTPRRPSRLDRHRASPRGRSVRLRSWVGSTLHELDVSVLLVTLLISFAIMGFAFLTDFMLEGKSSGFDQQILLAMRHPADLADPIGPGWVEEIGRDFTALGSTAILMLFTLAVTGYLLMTHKPRLAVVLVFITLGALTTSHLLKHFIDRPRPALVPHGTVVYTKSFPSGHSMQSAATYLTLAALLARAQRRRRIGAYLIGTAAVLTLLVGTSRVYLGVHWPTDVFAGWAVGASWALLAWLLVRWLQRHGQVEPGPPEQDEVYPAQDA